MKALAFDTSSELLSVFLHIDGQGIGILFDTGLRHTERLMPVIRDLVHQAGCNAKDLDLVICSKGPGSFTGLRIGMATAKGFAAGLGIPVVAVPSLDCLAYGHAHAADCVLPVIDARRGRFYTALYVRGERTSEYLDLAFEEIAARTKTYSRVLLTGPHANRLAILTDDPRYIVDPLHRESKAGVLCTLGMEAFAAGHTESICVGPMYIRPSDAEEKGN